MWVGRGGAVVVVAERIDRVKSPALRLGHGERESRSQGQGRQPRVARLGSRPAASRKMEGRVVAIYTTPDSTRDASAGVGKANPERASTRECENRGGELDDAKVSRPVRRRGWGNTLIGS
jgi:hypothetical protein